MNSTKSLILVTGATGYIGGRLVPRLLSAGYQVRCLVRDADRLQGRSWSKAVQIAVGDVLNPETLAEAMKGVDAAYYMVHGMKDAADFHDRDLIAAENFGNAARNAGVMRLVYLGGLGDPETDLSRHLRSRQETGRALCQSGVPVTEFRAAIVVGSGSVSFEMIRYLAERLPVMICPRWVYTRVQPIAIRNVLDYLVAALEKPESAGQIVEIGGADVLTYGQMMMQYAQVRKLRRYLLPVPVLTPSLSSYWVHWVTPIPSSIARPLIEGLRNEVVVRDDAARRLFPEIQPMGYREAVARSLQRLELGQTETIWSDALSTSRGDAPPVMLTTQDGMVMERRQTFVQAQPQAVFEVFSGLGGARGWLYARWAWEIRGLLDRLAGGVGMRRGRRHPDHLRVGDAVDFWRVEALEPERLLRLRAEMKVPGRAWLQFEVQPHSPGSSTLVQTAYFAPKGLWGLLYWYGIYPFHAIIFSGMIHAIARQAEGSDSQSACLSANNRRTR